MLATVALGREISGASPPLWGVTVILKLTVPHAPLMLSKTTKLVVEAAPVIILFERPVIALRLRANAEDTVQSQLSYKS